MRDVLLTVRRGPRQARVVVGGSSGSSGPSGGVGPECPDADRRRAVQNGGSRPAARVLSSAPRLGDPDSRPSQPVPGRRPRAREEAAADSRSGERPSPAPSILRGGGGPCATEPRAPPSPPPGPGGRARVAGRPGDGWRGAAPARAPRPSPSPVRPAWQRDLKRRLWLARP